MVRLDQRVGLLSPTDPAQTSSADVPGFGSDPVLDGGERLIVCFSPPRASGGGVGVLNSVE